MHLVVLATIHRGSLLIPTTLIVIGRQLAAFLLRSVTRGIFFRVIMVVLLANPFWHYLLLLLLLLFLQLHMLSKNAVLLVTIHVHLMETVLEYLS